MVKIKSDNWRIWKIDKNVEARTFKRVKKKLPEMECAKQLREILGKIYIKKWKC